MAVDKLTAMHRHSAAPWLCVSRSSGLNGMFIVPILVCPTIIVLPCCYYIIISYFKQY